MITAIGPSFAPVIVLIALMATIGGPTAWMRMNDIGAARTELAMAQISANMAGSSIEGNALSLAGFVFILWGAALNNSGWIIIGGYGAPFLDKAVIYLKENFNATWIKLLMAAASLVCSPPCFPIPLSRKQSALIICMPHLFLSLLCSLLVKHLPSINDSKNSALALQC